MSRTLVKVCGVTTPEDATQAAVAGADFIGMILWPKSKRSIPLDVAEQVADAAKAAGATPIGVFVDESAEEIVAACEAVGIDHAQRILGDDTWNRIVASGGEAGTTKIFFAAEGAEYLVAHAPTRNEQINIYLTRLPG